MALAIEKAGLAPKKKNRKTRSASEKSSTHEDLQVPLREVPEDATVTCPACEKTITLADQHYCPRNPRKRPDYRPRKGLRNWQSQTAVPIDTQEATSITPVARHGFPTMDSATATTDNKPKPTTRSKAMANAIPKNLVPTEEAAGLLGVGRGALTNYKRDDLIESKRIGRHEYYDLDDLEELIAYMKDNRLGPYSNRGGAKAVDTAPKKKAAKKSKANLITTQQASKLTGYSTTTIFKWAAGGEIKLKGQGPRGSKLWDRGEILEIAADRKQSGKNAPRRSSVPQKPRPKREKPQAVNPFPFGEVGKPTLTNGTDHGVAFSLTQAAHFVASWRQKHDVHMEQDAEWDLIQGVYKIIAG